MIALLRKWWFLIVLVAAVAFPCWHPQWFQSIHLDELPARALVVGSLFLMAWSLDSRALLGALSRPGPALWAAVISYGLVPPLGWLAGQFLPQADLSIGLIIITSVPCTLASAVVWTRRAGGNDATAVLVILLTTATSWLATTGWLSLTTGSEIHLRSGAMMKDLVVLLIVPVGLGQSCRLVKPFAALAARHKKVFGLVAQLLILAVIVKASIMVGVRMQENSAWETGTVLLAALASMIVHLLAVAGGFWSARGWGFDRPEQIAVAFAGSQKTLPVALMLFDTYFKNYPLAVIPLVFYHVGQLIVDTVIADKLAERTQMAQRAVDGVSD